MAQNYFENDFMAIDWVLAHFGYDCDDEFLLKQGFDQKTIDEYWERERAFYKNEQANESNEYWEAFCQYNNI